MSPGDTILFRMENIVLVTLKNNKDHLGHYLRVILCILNRLFAFKDSRSDVGMSCLSSTQGYTHGRDIRTLFYFIFYMALIIFESMSAVIY